MQRMWVLHYNWKVIMANRKYRRLKCMLCAATTNDKDPESDLDKHYSKEHPQWRA